MPEVCLSAVLLFTIFIIVVTQNFSSPKTSQQNVRKIYRPLLVFFTPCKKNTQKQSKRCKNECVVTIVFGSFSTFPRSKIIENPRLPRNYIYGPFKKKIVQGLRKYILKQDPSTIPATRTKLR